MIGSEELREHWTQAVPRWKACSAFVRETMAPVSRALIEGVAPGPGDRWLDIASGVGDPAIEIVDRVAPGGLVVVSDLVPAMTAAARDAVAEHGGHVAAIALAAEAIAAQRAFDGVTCRFGAMFFADPPLALAQIRGVVRPGGRAGFAVWSRVDANPMFAALNAAIAEIVPDLPDPEPDAPGAFRYAAEGVFAGLVRDAAWVQVEEIVLPFTMRSEIDFAAYWDRLTTLSGELETLLEELTEDRATALRRLVRDRVAPHFASGAMRLPAEVRFVFAATPD